MKNHDYVIVGAGFFGSVVAERIANDLNKSVLVLDSRSHIGGNCYSEKDSQTGIEYHKFGTHIFHTSSSQVWEYISQFMELNGYYHQVLTKFENKVFQMPINLETINTFYNKSLSPSEAKEFIKSEVKKENYPNPKNLEEKAISQIGRPLYEAFIKGYTTKQWGKDPKDLPASIINRLPIRYNYNETYFHNAKWQGIPKDGYTEIFNKLLDSPNITVQLDTDFFDIKDQFVKDQKIIYTGPIDRFFDYKHGKLDWRSIRLEKKVIDEEDFQGTSVMNYAESDVDFTRIHEPSHLHPERNYQNEKTVIFYEYPEINDDPFYPLNDNKNRELLEKYQNEATLLDNVIFGGRLGTYKYYDMDQVIGQALMTYKTKILEN